MFFTDHTREIRALQARIAYLEHTVQVLTEHVGLSREEIDSRTGALPGFGPGAALPGPVVADVRRLLGQGRKIEAIKLVREQTGMGLKEAKDTVERL